MPRERPEYFYSDWDAFCREVLAARLGRKDQDIAALLLAGGAILGAAGLLALIAGNREIIDRAGRTWGIDRLSALAGGGVVVGAVAGASSGWLTRTLSRHTSSANVSRARDELAEARREFEELHRTRWTFRMKGRDQRAAVEQLFDRLTRAT